MNLETIRIFGTEYFSPKAVAGALQVTVSSVYNMVRRGELSAVRVGGKVLIPVNSVRIFAISNGLMSKEDAAARFTHGR